MEYKLLRPSQVVLDPENPRLPDGTSSDKEAINRLLDEGYDQLVALAQDLAVTGEANPAELPIAIREGRKFLVLEGNRRFAALKLLNDPQLADDRAHVAAFKRLANRGTPPKAIYSAIADDREKADHWIRLRHTGANNGVGVKRWSVEQTATHGRRMKAPVDSGTIRSIVIADELTEVYQWDEQLIDVIRRVRSARLTNIGRLFSPDVLTRARLEVRLTPGGTNPGELWAVYTAADLHDFFRWAFEVLDTESVDKFKNPIIRSTLLDESADRLPTAGAAREQMHRLADTPSGATGAPSASGTPSDSAASGSPAAGPGSAAAAGGGPGVSAPSSGGNSPGGGTNTGGSSQPTGRSRDAAREKWLYSQVRLPNLPTPVQRLLKEAKGVSMDDNPAIACILSRVVLELAVSSPDVLTWSGSKESDSLASKISACLVKLDPNIGHGRKRTRRDLTQAYLETEAKGIEYMHQFMHNSEVHAYPDIARRFSAAFSPLLTDIDNAIGSAP